MGEKTHRQQIVCERCPGKMAQRRQQQLAHRFEVRFPGRKEQQCADPRETCNGREIAIAEVLTFN